MAQFKRVISQIFVGKRKKLRFDPNSTEIPIAILQSCNFIEKYALDVIGIFRLSGDYKKILSLLRAFEKGEIVHWDESSNPHNVSGFLKCWLCELDDPLLTSIHQDSLLTILRKDRSVKENSSKLDEKMRELPVGNQRIFQRVIQMLAKVADNSKVNKMEVKNLAIIFSPTFFRTQTQNLQDLLQFNHLSAYFIEFCINNYELIFTTELPGMKQRTKILSTKVIKSKLRHFISKRQKPNLSFELREYENTQDISVPYQFRKKVSFSETKAESKKSPISRLQRKLSKSRISKSQRNILKESDISISDYEKPFFSEIEGNSKKIYHEYNVEIMDPEEKEEMNEDDDALVDDYEVNNNSIDGQDKNDVNNSIGSSSLNNNNNRNGDGYNVNNASNRIDGHQNIDLNSSSSNSDTKQFSFELGSSTSSSENDDNGNREEFIYEIGDDDEEDEEDIGDGDIDDGGIPISSFDKIFVTGDEKGDLKNHVNNLFLQAQQDFNLLSLSIPFGTEMHEGDDNNTTNKGGVDLNNTTTIPMNLISADQYLSFPDSILLPSLPPTPRDQTQEGGNSKSISNNSKFDQFLHSSPPTGNLPLEPTSNRTTNDDNNGDDHHHNLSLLINNHEYSLNLPPLPQSPRSPRPSSFTSPSRQLLKAYSLGDSSNSSGSSPVTPPAPTSRRRRGSESRNKDEVVVFLDELVSGIASPPTSPQSLRFRRRSCSSNATSNTRSSSTPIFDSNSSEISSPPVGRGAITLSSSPLHCSSTNSIKDRPVNRHQNNVGNHDDDIVVENNEILLSSKKINISKSSSSSSSSSDDSSSFIEMKNNNIHLHNHNNNNNDNQNGNYNRRTKKIEYKEIENEKEYLSRDEYNQFIDSLLGQTDDLVSSIDMKEFYDVEEEMEEDVIIHDGAFTSDHMVVIYKDGSRYEGGIKENKWFGKGKCFFSDGSIYEGDVLDDQIHGIGTLVYQNGDEYIGEWCKDLRHGWGRYLSSNGDVYEGDFVDDKQHGMGVFVANNGSKYVGEFKFGLPDGKGVWKYDNGDEYYGNFEKEEFEGFGVYVSVNGSKYEGQFHCGKKHGVGTLTLASGDVYSGQFQNDVFHGFGCLKLVNGAEINDIFHNGHPLNNLNNNNISVLKSTSENSHSPSTTSSSSTISI